MGCTVRADQWQGIEVISSEDDNGIEDREFELGEMIEIRERLFPPGLGDDYGSRGEHTFQHASADILLYAINNRSRPINNILPCSLLQVPVSDFKCFRIIRVGP